jgi:type I restriction enzyme R subunit
VWTKTSKKDRMFYVRMNNSTRELPDADLAEYVADHWTALTALQ